LLRTVGEKKSGKKTQPSSYQQKRRKPGNRYTKTDWEDCKITRDENQKGRNLCTAAKEQHEKYEWTRSGQLVKEIVEPALKPNRRAPESKRKKNYGQKKPARVRKDQGTPTDWKSKNSSTAQNRKI